MINAMWNMQNLLRVNAIKESVNELKIYIKVVRLYVELSKIGGCQEVEKASIRPVWAIILKEALSKLKGR
jgi:hypothetical protein